MNVIDEYLAGIDKKSRAELERIRAIIKQTVPAAKEVISYGVPAFYYKNKYLIGFAAFKKHLSLFPESGPIEANKYDLRKYKLSKGTIQFTPDHLLPKDLIIKLLEYNVSKTDRVTNHQ